jgi:hypothetical protein
MGWCGSNSRISTRSANDNGHAALETILVSTRAASELAYGDCTHGRAVEHKSSVLDRGHRQQGHFGAIRTTHCSLG